MSIPEQIRALEELAAVDAELRQLEDELREARGTLDTLRAGLAKLDEKLGVDRAALAQNEKLKGELVADVRHMSQQVEHSRDKMNRARTEREVNAAQRESEELRKLIRDREDEIGRLSTEGEALRLQIMGTEEEHQKLQEELTAQEGGITSQLGDGEGARATKISGRDAIAKRLPPVLYRRYETIRSKRGVGIAQTTDGICKACNMALPPQLFHRLRREPLLDQCPSCNRIIYFVPPSPAAGQAEQGKT